MLPWESKFDGKLLFMVFNEKVFVELITKWSIVSVVVRLAVENLLIRKTASSEKVAIAKRYNYFKKVEVLKKQKLWKCSLLKN